MKGDALLFMLFSWGCVISLTTYCFSKLFSSDNRRKGRRKKTKGTPPGAGTPARKSKTS